MKDIHEYIENRIGRVLDFVDARMYSTSRFTYISKSSADGSQDFVQGQPNAPGEQAADDPVARLGGGGWGLAAVPPAGEPCLVVRPGGGPTNGIIAAVGSKRYMPANMADGDVSLFCKQSGVTVYLKASDGSLKMTDKGGASATLDGSGNITLQPKVGGTVTVTADPTGGVNLGQGLAQVLVQGTTDAIFGAPVLQFPGASASVVKSG